MIISVNYVADLGITVGVFKLRLSVALALGIVFRTLCLILSSQTLVGHRATSVPDSILSFASGGVLLKLYCPNGVMNLVSSFWKWYVPKPTNGTNLLCVSSTFGGGWTL